ncbi:MAG: hypothetical protein ACK5PP_01380 [Acidimicrobiales bacterium]
MAPAPDGFPVPVTAAGTDPTAGLDPRIDRPHTDPAAAPTLRARPRPPDPAVAPTRRARPGGPDPAASEPDRPWRDVHRLVVVAPGPGARPVTVATQVAVRPGDGSATFVAAVLGLGDRPVAMSELELAAPRHGLELRGPGLWAAHHCEDPFVHWSFGLEAFALLVDRPDTLLGDGYGDRIALGWDLELETTGPAEIFDPGGYHQVGRGHGLLLVGRDAYALDGRAVRTHTWGRHRLPGDAAPDDASLHDGAPASGAVALPDGVDVWSVTPGRVQPQT